MTLGERCVILSFNVDHQQTSSDLHYDIQKYFHMIELYHLILRESNSTTLTESIEEESNHLDIHKVKQRESSTTTEMKGHTVREIFSKISLFLNHPIPRLNCKIIGLRSIKGMDGVNFMLSMPKAKLDYLQLGDNLEALWLEVDIQASKSSIINGQNRCEIIKTIGKGGFSLVYLIRNYRIAKTKHKSNGFLKSTKIFDYEGDCTWKVSDPENNWFRPSEDVRTDKSSISIYALKSMDKSIIEDWKKMDYVMNEKEILSSISHPFIVKMYYSFATKNYLNLVLDFCPGGELFFHIVKNRRLKESVAKFYIAEIILAVEHLHNNNILYRDLKPENVLIDYDGHIKLTDFGLSATNFK